MARAYKRKASDTTYTAHWINEHGRPQTERKYSDRRRTLMYAQRRESEAQRIRDGEVDPRTRRIAAQAKRSIADHAADYAQYLRSKGDCAEHVERTQRLIVEAAGAAGWDTAADLDPVQAAHYLESLAAKGKAARTTNWRRSALRAFSRWLYMSGRTTHDTLLNVPARRQSPTRRRRALSDGEVESLIAAARGRSTATIIKRQRRRNKKGELVLVSKPAKITLPDRDWLYRIAVATGLRVGELASLTPASFKLGKRPVVTVRAAYSKRRRDDTLPISADLAAELKRWISGKPSDEPLWPRLTAVRARLADVMRSDLRAAGIAADAVEDGQVDFHALRHTFITRVARRTDPKRAQALARHSTITLTMDVYAHVEQDELREVIDGLPAIDAAPRLRIVGE